MNKYIKPVYLTILALVLAITIILSFIAFKEAVELQDKVQEQEALIIEQEEYIDVLKINCKDLFVELQELKVD